ncbi:hypothetical protein L211DRAFT_852899 [Terfezia boudieri ATCC MYA-4762]|uniref:Uncharacterized protein n=1 Tax=Terfezia boudieri ATCC MYA-4762 TaxID=1051890 RepID=A0A3N4LE88_9PEZI|nr:hypothetical protein L211DRAFT_852899 [Terfezia boudieri ATCC MYA-4762]
MLALMLVLLVLALLVMLLLVLILAAIPRLYAFVLEYSTLSNTFLSTPKQIHHGSPQRLIHGYFLKHCYFLVRELLCGLYSSGGIGVYTSGTSTLRSKSAKDLRLGGIVVYVFVDASSDRYSHHHILGVAYSSPYERPVPTNFAAAMQEFFVLTGPFVGLPRMNIYARLSLEYAR